MTSSGSDDIFVAKYDQSGTVLWARKAGGTSNFEEGRGITVDGSGNSYVTGTFSGTATFGSFTLTSCGSNDVFVAKYDASGTVLWARNAGGTSVDVGQGIALDASGNSYVTGRFDSTATFGSDTLTGSGAYDAFVAKLSPPNPAQPPAPDSVVYAMLSIGDTLLMAGDFASVQGQTRNNLAAIQLSTNTLLPWNPNADGPVRTMYRKGDSLYVGGDFANLGGSPHGNLGLVRISTGTVDHSWFPNTDGSVMAMAMHPNPDSVCLFIGGDFQTVNGANRPYLAWVDGVTGAVGIFGTSSTTTGGHHHTQTFNPLMDNIVMALSHTGSHLYVGGQFEAVGTDSIGHLARFNTSATGTPTLDTGFNTGANGYVCGFSYNPNTQDLYVGGNFTDMTQTTGSGPGRLAKIGTVIGNVRGPGKIVDGPDYILSGFWDPQANGPVCALTQVNDRLLVGGEFSSIGGEIRGNVALLDTDSGAALPWEPNADGGVSSIVVSDSGIYIGGSYLRIGGQNQPRISRYNVPQNLVTTLDFALLSFTGETDARGNHLTWRVSDDKSAKLYRLSRSRDGRNYEPLAAMENRAGTWVYTFRDVAPEAHTYYKLEALLAEQTLTSTLKLDVTDVHIYPNPAKGQFTIQNSQEGEKELRILDATGKQVAVHRFTSTQQTIATEGLPAGLYILQLVQEGKVSTHRLVVE